MRKTILITGSTDGIGLETARVLAEQGHRVLLHGRNPTKLEEVKSALADTLGDGQVEGYLADLSRITDVERFAGSVAQGHPSLDVLINNAGVYRVAEPKTDDGLDVRFVVNTIAPYLLTKRLMPLLGETGRVINVSSAAQAPVDLQALAGRRHLSDSAAYAQSKLALTMWSRSLALGGEGPVIVAVNPKSLLGSKMVREAYGISGSDLRVGADILIRASLSEEFATASGKYFDNDIGQFSSPHPEALDPEKAEAMVRVIEGLLVAGAR